MVSRIVFVFILILLNAFFVAAEIALVALRHSKIEELIRKGNPTAKLLKRATNDLNSYISGIQLGITIVSLVLGWLIGDQALAANLSSIFAFLPPNLVTFFVRPLAILIIFLLVTFLQIVLGELVPKAIALQNTDTVALIIIAPLVLIITILKPIIKILNQSSILVLKLLRLPQITHQNINYSEDEVEMILDQSKKTGLIPYDQAKMAQNVFRLGNIPVRNMMVPRPDIVAFPVNLTVEELLENAALNNSFSRFPVYKNSINDIVGFIHIKDVYRSLSQVDKKRKLMQTSFIRNIIYIPETKKANLLLLEMRRKHIHVAVVTDEFGDTAGIVTLEDLIESLVGEIEDEFDQPVKDVQKQANGSYLIDGRASFEAIRKKFNLSVIDGEEYATFGGFVFGLLGHVPKAGERLKLDSTVLEVAGIEGKRIKSVLLMKEKGN